MPRHQRNGKLREMSPSKILEEINELEGSSKNPLRLEYLKRHYKKKIDAQYERSRRRNRDRERKRNRKKIREKYVEAWSQEYVAEIIMIFFTGAVLLSTSAVIAEAARLSSGL